MFFAITGLVHSIFVLIFSITEEFDDGDDESYPDSSEIDSKRTTTIVIAVIFQIIFYLGELSVFWITRVKVMQTLKTML